MNRRYRWVFSVTSIGALGGALAVMPIGAPDPPAAFAAGPYAITAQATQQARDDASEAAIEEVISNAAANQATHGDAGQAAREQQRRSPANTAGRDDVIGQVISDALAGQASATAQPAAPSPEQTRSAPKAGATRRAAEVAPQPQTAPQAGAAATAADTAAKEEFERILAGVSGEAAAAHALSGRHVEHHRTRKGATHRKPAPAPEIARAGETPPPAAEPVPTTPPRAAEQAQPLPQAPPTPQDEGAAVAANAAPPMSAATHAPPVSADSHKLATTSATPAATATPAPGASANPPPASTPEATAPQSPPSTPPAAAVAEAPSPTTPEQAAPNPGQSPISSGQTTADAQASPSSTGTSGDIRDVLKREIASAQGLLAQSGAGGAGSNANTYRLPSASPNGADQTSASADLAPRDKGVLGALSPYIPDWLGHMSPAEAFGWFGGLGLARALLGGGINARRRFDGWPPPARPSPFPRHGRSAIRLLPGADRIRPRAR